MGDGEIGWVVVTAVASSKLVTHGVGSSSRRWSGPERVRNPSDKNSGDGGCVKTHLLHNFNLGRTVRDKTEFYSIKM